MTRLRMNPDIAFPVLVVGCILLALWSIVTLLPPVCELPNNSGQIFVSAEGCQRRGGTIENDTNPGLFWSVLFPLMLVALERRHYHRLSNYCKIEYGYVYASEKVFLYGYFLPIVGSGMIALVTLAVAQTLGWAGLPFLPIFAALACVYLAGLHTTVALSK